MENATFQHFITFYEPSQVQTKEPPEKSPDIGQ